MLDAITFLWPTMAWRSHAKGHGEDAVRLYCILSMLKASAAGASTQIRGELDTF